MPEENGSNNPLFLIKSLDAYLKDYSYEIEYYLEGFAIRFFDQQEEGHMIVIFYDFEKLSYEISSFYADHTNFKSTNISSMDNLTKIALKFFLNLELVDGMRLKKLNK